MASRQRSFNPRARVGRDSKPSADGAGKACFNPRARVGRDAGAATPCPQRQVSIHAPAWGATGAFARGARKGRSFNPRARVGRDKLASGRETEYQSFNPRARVGRDRSPRVRSSLTASFNPRARVGRDRQ